MSETNAGRALGAVFYGGVELAFVVAHLHRADRSRAHQAHRFDGLLSEHENVERVTVVAVRLRDEAVVRGIVHRGRGRDRP